MFLYLAGIWIGCSFRYEVSTSVIKCLEFTNIEFSRLLSHLSGQGSNFRSVVWNGVLKHNVMGQESTVSHIWRLPSLPLFLPHVDCSQPLFFSMQKNAREMASEASGREKRELALLVWHSRSFPRVQQ